MTTTATFSSGSFALSSVVVLTSASLRVTFTYSPQQSDPAGTNDALNVANWTLTGTVPLTVTNAIVVPGNTLQVDLLLSGALTTGNWTVSASTAIETLSGTPLTSPTSLSFMYSGVTAGANVIAPSVATTPDTEDSIKDLLPPMFAGSGWNAVVAALATGDTIKRDNARLATNQLFLKTATGPFLTRLANNYRVQKSHKIGMSDESFRALALTEAFHKLTPYALMQVLGVFYGDMATQAHVVTNASSPFALVDGDTLSILVNRKHAARVTFHAVQFANIAAATVNEVAAVITAAMDRQGVGAYATAYLDPTTNTSKLVLFSEELGLGSFIQVTGGSALNAFQFGTSPWSNTVGNVWSVTIPEPGVARYEISTDASGGTNTLAGVRVGDILNVSGGVFDDANRGTFPVTNVFVDTPSALVQYVEVSNSNAIAQGVTTTTLSDVVVWRLLPASLQSASKSAFISVHQGTEAYLPVTSTITERSNGQASFLSPGSVVDASSIVRTTAGVTTITTSSSHGLSVGDTFVIDNPANDYSLPAHVAGQVATSPYTLDASQMSIWSQAQPSTLYDMLVIKKTDGSGAWLVGGYDGATESATSSYITFTGSAVLSGGDADGRTQYDYTVTSAGAIAVARRYAMGGMVIDEYPIFWGGYSAAAGVLQDAYTYVDVASGWTPIPGAGPLNPRALGQGVVVDGENYWIGGIIDRATPTNTVEKYDFSTGSVVAVGTLPDACYDQVALRVDAWGSPAILNMGGRQLASGVVLGSGAGAGPILLDDTNTEVVDTCNEMTPIAGSYWVSTASLNVARCNFAVADMQNGTLLVVGGYGRNKRLESVNRVLNDAELYWLGTANNTHSYSIPPMKYARRYCHAEFIASINKVLVWGGVDASGNPVTQAEYYNVETGEWELVPEPSPYSQANSASVQLSNEIVLSLGANASGTPTYSTAFIPGSDKIGRPPRNGVVLTTPTATTFTFTDEPLYYKGTSALIVPTAAATSPFLGPFSLDPNGPSITAYATTTTMQLVTQRSYLVLTVADATAFPNSGYIAIGYGNDNAIYPVKYTDKLSSTQLVLDPTYRFPVTVAAGASVIYLTSRTSLDVADPASVGISFLTDSNAATAAAVTALKRVAATGIPLVADLVYPSDIGLGNGGYATTGDKVSEKVGIWSEDVDEAYRKARA